MPGDVVEDLGDLRLRQIGQCPAQLGEVLLCRVRQQTHRPGTHVPDHALVALRHDSPTSPSTFSANARQVFAASRSRSLPGALRL
ncbi:MAG: hypothetical protein LH603_06660 [Pseudonocardia sp.]|nr:hypothetical protein [Pseudonocardia sp.]